MKKSFLFVTLTLVAIHVYCSNDQYTVAMKAVIETMFSSVTTEEYLQCANSFERIASAEKDKWLPYYYASYTYILFSNMEQKDLEKKDMILDKARELMDDAFSRAPDESEIYVLQAFLYSLRILVDPISRGMEYMGKINESMNRARELDPENPRIYFLEAVMVLNLPPEMGGGAEKAKPIFELAEAKFNSFNPESPISPDWGKTANEAELLKLR